MKKIVLINQSSGYLTIDIANAFAQQYDEVILIAGSIRFFERPLDTKIKMKKITAYNRNSTFGRLFSWLKGSLQILYLILFRFKKHELIFFTNPPFAYLSAGMIKRRYSIVVYDTYPDALKNIGIKETNLFYRLWQKWNKKIFPKAMNIFTLSESMSEQLTLYVEKEKIKIIPNWAASDIFESIPKQDNFFVTKYGLKNKFVILYSGNMGYSHNLDTLIEVALRLKSKPEIQFVFIGEGKKKSELISFKEKHKLENCLFLPWQKAKDLPYILAAADLGVITLNNATTLLSVPSKTYNLLAAGVPLLCISGTSSELAHIVEIYGNGKNFQSDETEAIASFILHLSENREKLRILSEHSLMAAKNFSRENANLYVHYHALS